MLHVPICSSRHELKVESQIYREHIKIINNWYQLISTDYFSQRPLLRSGWSAPFCFLATSQAKAVDALVGLVGFAKGFPGDSPGFLPHLHKEHLTTTKTTICIEIIEPNAKRLSKQTTPYQLAAQCSIGFNRWKQSDWGTTGNHHPPEHVAVAEEQPVPWLKYVGSASISCCPLHACHFQHALCALGFGPTSSASFKDFQQLLPLSPKSCVSIWIWVTKS